MTLSCSGVQCDTGFNLPKKENGSCGGQYNLASKKGDLPTPTIQVVLPFSAVTEDEFQKQLTQDSEVSASASEPCSKSLCVERLSKREVQKKH